MVTVQESKTSRTEWVFPCFRWLDDHIGDQSTVCSLKSIGARSVVSQKLQEHSGTWTFEICGSEIKHNEGFIWLTLIVCGDKGYRKVRLHVTGPTLQIKEQIPEVGMIYKVCVSSKPDKVQQTWRLKTIDMKNLESMLEMHLNFDCLFVTNTHNYVELPALFPDQDPDPVVEYRINVYTGDVRNAGFTGEVYISLHGDRGNTGTRWLSKSQNTPNTFCRGQVDVFKIIAVNVGEVKELVIGHKSQRKALMDCTDRWFLEKVIVAEGDMPTTQHTFMHNDWIDAHPKKPDVYEVVMPVKETVEIRSDPIKEPETGKARHWNMWVKCSPVPERPIDVSVIIFGEKGKSPLLRAENFHDKPFPVHTGEIGAILKVSFFCKSPEKMKGLKLEKLRMKDSVTKQELGFDTTDRWLFEEKRLETVTELAAVRPDRPPLRDLIYSVKVHTGDLPAAATDAHISIALFGENGDTGVRRLTDSASRILLDKGKVNVFCLRAVELGLLTKLTVEHSNEGYGAGCYLDRITVQASADTDAEFVFPCQQWLDSGTGDRWTKREIKLLGKVSSHSRMTADPQGTWDIHVLTGASSSIAVDSEVILEVCGERGMCSSLTLPGNKLRPGQMYLTVTEIDRKNGAILKIRLQTIEAREGGVWYCKEIKLQNRNTNEKIEFPVLRYLGDKEENLVLELPVIRKDGDLLKVKDYTVIVTSGPASEYETEPDVFVTLWGSLGVTGKRQLPRRRGSSHFNKEKVYVFQVEAVDIGLLEEVEVEKGRGSDWYLKQIVVKEGVYVEKEAVCVTKTWLDNRKRNLKLPLNDFQVNTIMPLTGLGEKEMKSDGLWCVYPVTPLEEKVGNPSLFSCLVMILYGSKGKSKPLFWKPKESYSIEDPTVYEIELQEDLGEIYKVRLGLNSSTNKTAQVSICPFRMQNADTLDSFICCVNETLPLSSSGDRWLEVPVEWPLRPSLRVAVYHTTLFSSDFYKIRQPPQVALCVYGDHGDTGERPLLWPLHTQDQKDGTKAFTFEIVAVELGDLSKIVLTVSSKMSVSVHVDEIHLRDKADKEKLYVFNVNEEFNVGPDQETTVKEIKLSSVMSKGQRKVTPVKERVNSHGDDKDDEAEFLVITFTGDVAGAGTNAHVHIVLFGNQGSSESIPLSATEEKWDPFEKGQVDTFKVKTRSVGTLHKIEIGHDGRGLESGWFLEKVEIVHPQSNLKLVFPCNRWLSADEGDRKTTVQLHCEGF
nr:PREDICTED: lipoxygenase homology domain-containing protein 1-like isoform X2 [Lepisosteus oculatus]